MKKSARRPSAAAILILVFCTFALTAGIVGSAWMLSRFMLKVQKTTEKNIRVKGVAERMVRSDLGSFRCSVWVKAKTIPEGYTELNKVAETLRKKLLDFGFDASEFSDEIDYNAQYRTEKTVENGKTVSREYFDHYRFTYTVGVRTAKVDLIAQNHLKLYELTKDKININVNSPEYYISQPEQYKLALVDEASASATQRARTVADKCGSTLGPLLTARQGVIQITRPASNDTSDYGVYDTSSIDKVMRLVVTLEFSLL